jgi:hypothetical protein
MLKEMKTSLDRIAAQDLSIVNYRRSEKDIGCIKGRLDDFENMRKEAAESSAA